MIDRMNRGRRANERASWTIYAGGRYGPNDAGTPPGGLLFKRGRRPKLSDFRVRKLTLLFNCFDNDRDGCIDIVDFEQLARCIAEAYGLQPGTIKHALMYAETMAFWNAIKTTADHNGDGAIMLDEFMLIYDDMTRRDDSFARVRGGLASFLVRMGDRDRDDMLDEHEYTTLLSCFGIANANARSAFRRLLAPGATRLATIGLDRAVGELLRSDDSDAPGNWMFGPLG